jgi:hypothetical protein
MHILLLAYLQLCLHTGPKDMYVQGYSVTTLNYPVRSGPHYITNDIGSDLYRTRVTYRGVPGARWSC